MADIKIIELNGTELSIKDAKAREDITRLDSQFKDIANNKADKSITENIQQQVDNLVLHAGNPESSSAEITQARGNYETLNGRFESTDVQLQQTEKKIDDLFAGQYTGILNIPVKWELGGWNTNTGTTTDPVYTYFTIRGYLENVTENTEINVKIDTGYRLIVGKYNKSDNSYIGAEHHSESYTFLYDNSYVYRFSFHNLNDYNNKVRITDVNSVSSHCKLTTKQYCTNEIEKVKNDINIVTESTEIANRNVLSHCTIYNDQAMPGYDTTTLKPKFITKNDEFIAKYIIPQKGKLKIGISSVKYQYLMFVNKNDKRVANWTATSIKEGGYVEKITPEYVVIDIKLLRSVSAYSDAYAVYVGFLKSANNKYIREINIYDENDVEFLDMKVYSQKAQLSVPVLSEKDRYSWRCIHHDNFYRTPNSNMLWDIGTNGNNVYHMEYSSPYIDYSTVDDGFRIVNNKLKVENNIIGSEKDIVLRLASKAKLTDNVMLQFSSPEVGKVVGVVFNFKDISNYNAIYTIDNADNSLKYDILLHSVVDNKITTITIATFNYGENNNFSLFLSSLNSAIYVDDYFVNTLNVRLDKSLYVGLYCKKTWSNFEMKFFNIYNMGFKTVINPNRALDNTISPLYMMTLQVPDNRQDCYQIVDDIKCGDGYSQRFNLKNDDNIVASSKRCEVAFNLNELPLKKYTVEFDVLFPTDFISDKLTDIFYQVHDNPSGNDIATVLNPMVSLYVQSGKIYGDYIGMPKHSGTISDYNNRTKFEIGSLVTDKWYHFKMEVKEGYIPEHNPSFKLYVDEKLIFKGTKPNCFNQPKSGYPKYGIYKYDWKNTVGTVTERTLYIDNFIMEY